MTDCTQVPTLDEIYQAKKNITDLDTFANSTADTFVDSDGVTKTTLTGMINAGESAIISLGWHPVGLFADGFTYTLQNDIAKDSSGDWYRWNGTLPKVVTAGTLPSSDANFVKIDYKSHAELSDRNPADGSAHNADDIADSNGQKVQDYLSNHRSDNSSYVTTEQATNYTMTQNRHIFGEEYLWGFHKQVLDSGNSNLNKFIYSGDSTTAGNNAGEYTPSFVGTLVASDLGLARHEHINAGHSGNAAVDWDSTWVAQDIVNHPDMNVYIARWGINDGSAHGNVATYIAAMDSALGKLRAFKGVEALTIVVASPNSTYDDPHNRGTAWYEAAIPELRKICRKHMACFIDVYSIWQDAKQGARQYIPRWLDDPFSDGRGIHPDAAFNIQIQSRISEMIIKPIMYGQNLAINKFQSSDPNTFRPSYGVAPNAYPRGMALHTVRFSDGWPAIVGKLRTTRNGSKVIQELFLSEDDGTLTRNEYATHITRYGDSEVGSWSKWYGYATAPSLQNSWATVSGRTPKYTHKDNGLCCLMGTIDGGVDGTVIFTLPPEMRPSSPRTFLVAGSAGANGTVVVLDDGQVLPYMNSATYINLDGVVWSAGD